MEREEHTMGRTAHVRLKPEQLQRLESGKPLTIRLRPDTDTVKLSLKQGELDEMWTRFDEFMESFDNFMRRMRLRK